MTDTFQSEPRSLERRLKLPILLQIILDHLLDGIGTWAERVSGTASETLFDKVVQGVFLEESATCQERQLITDLQDDLLFLGHQP